MSYIRHYLQLYKIYIRNKQGVIAVEFALVFTVVMMVLLFVFELCRLIYLIGAINLTIAEAGRHGAYQESQTVIEANFRSALEKNMNNWPLFKKVNENIHVNIQYCLDVNDYLQNGCTSSPGDSRFLIIYNVDYHYKPIFFYFPGDVMNSILSEKAAIIYEHSLY